jgi:hypothetical protein
MTTTLKGCGLTGVIRGDDDRTEHHRGHDNQNDTRLRDLDTQDDDGHDEVEELSQLLEHMAFTAAMVVSSHHGSPDTMERILESFTRAVRDKTAAMVDNKDVLNRSNNDRH